MYNYFHTSRFGQILVYHRVLKSAFVILFLNYFILILSVMASNLSGTYTMTFSLHQGGVVMSSQITHTHSQPLAHIPDT